HQGTHGKLFALGLADRVLIASHAVWFYLGKILWPSGLAFSYPHWTLQPWNPLSYCWLLAAIVAAYAIYCAREDLGRGVEVAAVFFVATLSPMLGFIMLYTFLYSFVADHYQYLACLGPIALISAGIVKLAQSSPKYRPVIYAGASAIVLVLAWLTYLQCGIYHDSKTIWADTLEKNPDSLLANFDLGNDLMTAANDIADPTIRNIALKDSLERYNHALAIDPKYVGAWANRAQLLASLGRPEEARADYEHAVSLEPGNATAQNEYGIFLRKQGDPAGAAVHFRAASEAQPHWMPYRKNLIDALMAAHDFAGVLSEYQAIEGYFPNLPQSHIQLGPAWLNLGKPSEAIREYREALRLAPDSVEAQTRLAWLLATVRDPALRNPSEALELAEKACALTERENAVALNTLAAAYAANKRFDDAVNTCKEALAIAQHAGDKPLAATIQEHLRLYQTGHTLYDAKPQ
ncbi:MAG TPA: tetratricopeptide repeat protein, partial [Chthoniobacteraceae bacterium]|nr:tetratricopeptide repeat protein [Chthoniobacteraceae bacterium]